MIGAGLAGPAVARALAERNLPYTHLERHTRARRCLNLRHRQSRQPMYESAHFISSRTLFRVVSARHRSLCRPP
ncbi:hypothetical protein [Streptomyces sp. NBC_01352]|uniref:hypothetical protein n=1 Tax=Streptomyces sp. NBC_01352 TaxID=2903834 RepID=UPI002E34D9BB|nr:hypothetical protein [Streptomyces sp. NBC_01352]